MGGEEACCAMGMGMLALCIVSVSEEQDEPKDEQELVSRLVFCCASILAGAPASGESCVFKTYENVALAVSSEGSTANNG